MEPCSSFRPGGADHREHGRRGLGLRRRLTSVALLTLLVTLVQSFAAVTAQATPPSWTDGDRGQRPRAVPGSRLPVRTRPGPTASWTDLGRTTSGRRDAIDHVAGTNDWMRDVSPDENGNWRFRPDAFETRKRWARALVRAFARDEEPDPSITFTDLDPSDPFHRWAAIAVQHGWMTRGSGGRIPSERRRHESQHPSFARARAGDGPDRCGTRPPVHDRRL